MKKFLESKKEAVVNQFQNIKFNELDEQFHIQNYWRLIYNKTLDIKNKWKPTQNSLIQQFIKVSTKRDYKGLDLKFKNQSESLQERFLKEIKSKQPQKRVHSMVKNNLNLQQNIKENPKIFRRKSVCSSNLNYQTQKQLNLEKKENIFIVKQHQIQKNENQLRQSNYKNMLENTIQSKTSNQRISLFQKSLFNNTASHDKSLSIFSFDDDKRTENIVIPDKKQRSQINIQQYALKMQTSKTLMNSINNRASFSQRLINQSKVSFDTVELANNVNVDLLEKINQKKLIKALTKHKKNNQSSSSSISQITETLYNNVQGPFSFRGNISERKKNNVNIRINGVMTERKLSNPENEFFQNKLVNKIIKPNRHSIDDTSLAPLSERNLDNSNSLKKFMPISDRKANYILDQKLEKFRIDKDNFNQKELKKDSFSKFPKQNSLSQLPTKQLFNINYSNILKKRKQSLENNFILNFSKQSQTQPQTIMNTLPNDKRLSLTFQNNKIQFQNKIKSTVSNKEKNLLQIKSLTTFFPSLDKKSDIIPNYQLK